MKLQAFKYQLPFKAPFTIASGTYLYREGIILRYEHDGIIAYGEIAPLPGFSKESLGEAETQLINNKGFLLELLTIESRAEAINLLEKRAFFPSVEFGFDSLMVDYLSKKSSISFASYLFKKNEEPTPVNGVISTMDISHSLKRANVLNDQGFKTLKIKVGSSLQRELETVKNIRQELPHIQIRLDANGAWSNKEAIDALQAFHSYDIEYCEQPCSSIEELAEVKASSKVKIAADESARSYSDIQRIIATNAADVLILKPMLIGSINRVSVTNSLAMSHDLEVVYTTSLESAVGRTITAHIASGLGKHTFAHGLATGSLFSSDLSSRTMIHNGFCSLHTSAGLGIPELENNLKHLKDILN